MFRCDQAHALSVRRSDARTSDTASPAWTSRRHELRDGFIRLRLGLVLGIEQWNQCEIRGA